MNDLTVAVGQLTISDCNHEANMRQIAAMSREACAASPIDLLLWPELAVDGYDFDHLAALPDSSLLDFQRFWADLARELETPIIAGVTERIDGLHFDSALCWDAHGRRQATYRKIHLYGDENNFFQAGDQPVITKIKGWNVGLLICADFGFPEMLRQMAADGVELFALVSAWLTGHTALWETCAIARSTENLCYTAACNRFGPGPGGCGFIGHSMIVDPAGQVLRSLPFGDGVVSCCLHKEEIAQRQQVIPWLSSMRRPDVYGKKVRHEQ